MSLEPIIAWEALLDQMEAAADAVLADSVQELNVWEPPAGFPALPVELADRARAVSGKQKLALEHATDSKRVVSEHLAAVNQIPNPRFDTGQPAVYLDITG